MKLRSATTCAAGIITNLIRCVKSIPYHQPRKSYKAGDGHPLIPSLIRLHREDPVQIIDYATMRRMDRTILIESDMRRAIHKSTIIDLTNKIATWHGMAVTSSGLWINDIRTKVHSIGIKKMSKLCKMTKFGVYKCISNTQ